MTLKVLLAKPLVKFPINPNGDIGVPLGLLYLAAYVRRHEPTTEISFKDYRLEKYKCIARNLERDLSEVDVVAVGGSTTEIPDTLRILGVAKGLGKTTVAGGIFPSSNADYMLKSDVVDYVVRGEGEQTFAELLAAIQSNNPATGINGISYIRNGKIVHNQNRAALDLRTLPLPAYDLAPMTEYAKLATGSVYSARGCNMSCDFCTLGKHWSYSHRMRPVENIIDEMMLLSEYGFKRIHFKDESIVHNRERAMALFSAIKSAGIDVKIKGKARIDQLDDELLQVMRAAGVDMIHVGVESVSEQSLKDMHKGLTRGDIFHSLETILSHGIGVNPVYLFSWPGETPVDLKANADFIYGFGSMKDVVTYISFLTPHFGTRLREMAEQKGLVILTNDLNRYNHKQPVAVPASLGEKGLELMIDTYNNLAKNLHMQDVNPRISDYHLTELEKAA